jgi:hypothetical protein
MSIDKVIQDNTFFAHNKCSNNPLLFIVYPIILNAGGLDFHYIAN